MTGAVLALAALGAVMGTALAQLSRDPAAGPVSTTPVTVASADANGVQVTRTIPGLVGRTADLSQLDLVLERAGRAYYSGPGTVPGTVCLVVVESEVEAVASCDPTADFERDGLLVGDETGATWLLPPSLTSASADGRPLEIVQGIAFTDARSAGAVLEARGPWGQTQTITIPAPAG